MCKATQQIIAEKKLFFSNNSHDDCIDEVRNSIDLFMYFRYKVSQIFNCRRRGCSNKFL